VLSSPIIKTLIDGYEFLWCEGKEWVIKAIVTKIIEQPRGALSAELTIEHEFTERPPISRVRINLTSQQARNTIAKRLNDAKIIAGLDSSWLMEQICTEAIKLHREGEPIRELWTSEDIQPPEFLLEPILLKDLPTIIFGEKGVTKSNLALVFYIILTLPWDDNPLELIAPDRSIKTAILDWELPGNIAQWNLKKLQRGLNLPPLALYHRRCLSPLADDIETIQKYLLEIKAEAVIIDSLGRAVGGELLKDTENVNRFFSALDKLRVTPLILAQTSKEGDIKSKKRKSIYGSIFFEYYARSIFELCKSESIGEDEVSVALFHRSANLTKLEKPMGFRFNFNENKTEITREAVSYAEFYEKVSRQLQVTELLKMEPLKTEQIMEALGIRRSNADVTLKRLRDKKKIIKLDDGRWGIRTDKMF